MSYNMDFYIVEKSKLQEISNLKLDELKNKLKNDFRYKKYLYDDYEDLLYKSFLLKFLEAKNFLHIDYNEELRNNLSKRLKYIFDDDEINRQINNEDINLMKFDKNNKALKIILEFFRKKAILSYKAEYKTKEQAEMFERLDKQHRIAELEELDFNKNLKYETGLIKTSCYVFELFNLLFFKSKFKKNKYCILYEQG